MNMDRRNKNCYNCREFGYLARNCRNRGIGDRIGKGKRLEYRNKNQGQNNLNGKGDLIILDQVSVAVDIHYSRVIDNAFYYNLNNRELLREVTVKIRLERIDTQEEVTIEALLDSGAMDLVISSEFARKQEFKLKKIERPIYIRNINSFFNKEGLIEHIVEMNIYY